MYAIGFNGPRISPPIPRACGVMTAHSFKTGRKFNKRNRNAKAILQEEQKYVANANVDDPTYFSINTGPSLVPEKKWCDITGLTAPYKTKSGLRYHNVEVYEIVESLRPGVEQEYLKLRNANIVLK